METTTLQPFVVMLMHALAPTRTVESLTPLADAIVTVVSEEEPLFRGKDGRERTAALISAVAYRESGFDPKAVGDGGKSFCAMQIHESAGGTKSLLEDPVLCIRTGYRMLRTSIRVCREHPVAWYAEGPRGCTSSRGQWISRDRTNLANWAYDRVLWKLSHPGES